MVTPCLILKSFPYSEDGFTTKHAPAGETVGIPESLVAGLDQAGYVQAVGGVKDAGPSPENKMLPPLDNKSMDDLRAEMSALNGGGKVDARWGEKRLRDEIAKAKG